MPKDGVSEGASGTLPLRPRDVQDIQPIEIFRLCKTEVSFEHTMSHNSTYRISDAIQIFNHFWDRKF
jgi:hypothetical protein